MELDLKLAQKRSRVGRWSWAAKVELLSLRVVPQQRCNGHCPCDSAQARQLKQQLRGALVAGQWRGDTALTLPLFWRRSTVSPVFFGRYPRSCLDSFVPPPPPTPPVPVPNKPSRFCGRKAKCTRFWWGGGGRGGEGGSAIKYERAGEYNFKTRLKRVGLPSMQSKHAAYGCSSYGVVRVFLFLTRKHRPPVT